MSISIVDNPSQDAADVDMVVCHRVADLPIPYCEARRQRCSKCNERIWVALTSPTRPPLVCYPCAKQMIADDGDEPKILISRNTAECEATLSKVEELITPRGELDTP